MKKIICLVLCVLMLFSVAGCGKDNSKKNPASSEVSGGFDVDANGGTAQSGSIYKNILTGADTDLSSVNDNSVYKGRATDLKGKTVKVQSWGQSLDVTGAGILPQRVNQLISSIEKTLNCKIELITGNSGYNSATLSGLAAGKPTADIIYLSKLDLISNYSYNRLVPLGALNVFDFNDRSSFSSATELAKYNGEYYAVAPRTYGTTTFYIASCIFANLDVLKKCGVTIDDLNSWVDKNEWTWDKFEEVAEKVKSAGYTFMYDGSTHADNEREHSLYSSLLSSNGVDWVGQKSDGKLTFTGDSAKAEKALDFYKSMYDKGYVKQVDSGISKFSAGDSAMLCAAMYTPYFNERSVAWGNYTILPLPIGPDKKEYTYSSGDYSFAAIGKGTKPSGLTDAEIATVLNLLNTNLISEKENESLVVSESISWAKNALAQKTVKLYNNLTAQNKFDVTWSGIVLTNIDGDNDWFKKVFSYAGGQQSKQQILAQKSSYETFLSKFLDQ